jgi:uncharacterized protein
MTTKEYHEIEAYMLSQMQDSAHDRQHIYRVLYIALDIAESENNIDTDILITACLLHDIGRQQQFDNPLLCHATEGGAMAYDYLMSKGWSGSRSNHVKKCIGTHRFRADNLPDSIEAKILFDADKIDVSGAMGIARTLLYKGHTNEPLYQVNDEGQVIYEKNDSFIKEYNFKLKNLYNKFFTKRGREIAVGRQNAAVYFYECLLDEIETTHSQGKRLLDGELY